MHHAISSPVQLQARQNQDRWKVLMRRQEEHRNHLCRQVQDEVGTYPKDTSARTAAKRDSAELLSQKRAPNLLEDLSDRFNTWDTLKISELSLCTGLVDVPCSPTIGKPCHRRMCGAFIRAKYFIILELYCVSLQERHFPEIHPSGVCKRSVRSETLLSGHFVSPTRGRSIGANPLCLHS